MSDGLTLASAGLPAGPGIAAFTRSTALEGGFPGFKVFGDPGQPVSDLNGRPGKAGQRSPSQPSLSQPSSALADGGTLLAAQQQGGDAASPEGGPKASGELSEEEEQQVAKLKQIDAKVRAHERAHAAAGGQYAGAPSYGYTVGPDGQRYATSGEVPIDIGPEKDPHATLQKAAQVAAAALAPADPSGQDRAVAAAAAQLRLQALAQIREEARAKQDTAAVEPAAGHAESHGHAESQPEGGLPRAARDGSRDAARGAQAYANQPYADAATRPQPGRLIGLSA